MQTVVKALFRQCDDHLVLLENLRIMAIHPGESKDYWVLSGDSDQEGDGLLMEGNNLE